MCASGSPISGVRIHFNLITPFCPFNCQFLELSFYRSVCAVSHAVCSQPCSFLEKSLLTFIPASQLQFAPLIAGVNRFYWRKD